MVFGDGKAGVYFIARLFFIFLTGFVFSQKPQQAQAQAQVKAELSYIKSPYQNGHGVQCFDTSLGDGHLVTRSVDPALLNLKFQGLASGADSVSEKLQYNSFAVKEKKVTSRTYYDCQVFSEAIKKAPSLFTTAHWDPPTSRAGKLAARMKGKHCVDHYNEPLSSLKDLATKVGWFSKEDLREELTDKEWLETYRAVGQFRHKSLWPSIDHKDEVTPPNNALAVGCPDGKSDVIVTPAHAFRSAVEKESRFFEGLPKDHMRYSDQFLPYKIKSVEYGGWPSENPRRDWAVVKLEKPLPKEVKPLVIDPRADKKYTGCVRFVAWANDFREPDRRKQTCEITGELGYGISKLNDTQAGVDLVKHNCHTVNGSSGGALIACDTGQLVGMHIVEYGKDGKIVKDGSPYSDSERSWNSHFNGAILFSGKFLEAIKRACAQ